MASSEVGKKSANLNSIEIKTRGKGITAEEKIKKSDTKIAANQSPKTAVTEKENPLNKHDSTEEKTDKKDTAQDIEKEKEKKQQDKAESIKKIMESVKQSFNSIEGLDKFKDNLIMELTEEGVKIQLVDSAEQEMFKSGSPAPVKYTENIIKAIGQIVSTLANKINITGHTDSTPYNKKGYGNWELSSDRAHATRRILESCNIVNDRFLEVNGRADRDPLNKEDTKAPENRRISITILYSDLQKPQQEDTEDNPVAPKEKETELL